MPILTACPVCGASRSRELYRFEPARWIPGRVVRCRACRTVYKMPAADAKPLADYYDTSYAGADYWAQEQAALRVFTKIRAALVESLGTTSAALLDVGCGPGVFLSLAQQTGFQVTGLELNPILAQKAREHTGAEVIEGDFSAIALSGRRFDVVTLLDLIEHLPDPVAALKQCHALLKPGGWVVAYTPNHSGLICRVADWVYRLSLGQVAGPVVEIFDCTHVVFFDVRTLGLAMTKAGFSVVRTLLTKYDPTRSNQAIGISALALRGLEAISPLVRGQFRILMFGRKAG